MLYPGRHVCVFCSRTVSGFLPYRSGRQDMPKLMLALDLIGSDVDLFNCPWCNCHDRERHLYLYMTSLDIFSFIKNKSVLHFAPETHLSKKIMLAVPALYVKCDLFPQAEDVIRIDMLNIGFESESFDLVIANHVLEHVPDEARALDEIYRVLRKGGHAILQTPYSGVLEKTWSDPGIASDEARLQAYGQEDHVRLFGKDIFEVFQAAGFVSCVNYHDALLPQYPAFRYGVNSREPFFLFKKQ